VISRNSFNGVFRLARLGDVVEFLDSKRRPVTESDRRSGPYPYYGANGLQGTIDEFIFDEPLVLLAEDGGHFDDPERGIAYRVSGKTWVNNHAHVLRPGPNLDLAFLCRVLENYNVTPFVTGTTRGKLTQAGASEIVIPVPPLAEQRRIAEILDRAEVLRVSRRAASSQLDIVTRGIFLDLFGDPATNPKRWSSRPLGDVAEFFGGSTLPDGVKFSGQEDGYFLLKVSDMNLAGNETYLKVCQEWSDTPGARACTCPPGSVIIPKRGGAIGTNKKRLSTRNSVLDPNLMAIWPKPSHLELRFLYQWFLHLDLGTITSGSSVPQLNKQDLAPLKILLPPIDLQRDFARRASVVEKLKAMHRAFLAELDALFAVLQHRAFRGEL
jgi:type I restriction enzyme S subunit